MGRNRILKFAYKKNKLVDEARTSDLTSPFGVTMPKNEQRESRINEKQMINIYQVIM